MKQRTPRRAAEPGQHTYRKRSSDDEGTSEPSNCEEAKPALDLAKVPPAVYEVAQAEKNWKTVSVVAPIKEDPLDDILNEPVSSDPD